MTTKRMWIIGLATLFLFAGIQTEAANAPAAVTDFTKNDQKILIVAISGANHPQQGTAAYLNHTLFDTTNEFSLASYYESVSGGTLHFQGQVIGPIVNPITTTDLSGCENLPSDVLSIIPASVDLTQFHQVIFIRGCGASSGGGEGQYQRNGQTYNIHISFVGSYMNNIVPGSTQQPLPNDPNNLGFVNVFIHELGHSLSFIHEHGSMCGIKGFEKLDQCSFEEYGTFSAMGTGAKGNANAINIAAASAVGWIPLSQELTNPVPGSYNIFKRDSTGIKHLIFNSENSLPWFPLTSKTSIDNFPQSYVSAEFRPSFNSYPGGTRYNLGFNTSTPGVSFIWYLKRPLFYSQSNWPAQSDGLAVARELPGDWYQKGWSENLYAIAPDVSIGDEEGFVYGPGTGFYDYYTKRGVNVTQVLPDHASVLVVQDPQSCVRATPDFSFVSATPLASSDGHDNITMSYSVTNRDSTGCGASNFTLETYQATVYPSTFEERNNLPSPPLSGVRNANDWQAPTPTNISNLQPGETRTVTIPLTATTGQWRYGTAEFRLKNNSVLGVARTWEDPVGVQPLAGCTQRQPQISFTQPTYNQTTVSGLNIQVRVKNMDTGNCPTSDISVRFFPVFGNGVTVFVQGPPIPIYPYPPVDITLNPGQEQVISRTFPVENQPTQSPFTAGLFARASKKPLGTLPYGQSSYPFVSVASATYSYSPSYIPAQVRVVDPEYGALVSPINPTLISVNGSSPRGIQSIKLENQTRPYSNTINLSNPNLTTQTFTVPASAFAAGQNQFVATLTESNGQQVTNWINFALDNQCPADFDHNNILAPQDIFSFLNAWFAGDVAADFNRSAVLEPIDIFDFLNAWFAGCSATTVSPGAPQLTLPADGLYTSNPAQLTFSWQPVNYPNPISYAFIISRNPDFTADGYVYDRGLTGTTWTPQLQLSPGTYYWRVDAFETANFINSTPSRVRSFVVQ